MVRWGLGSRRSNTVLRALVALVTTCFVAGCGGFPGATDPVAAHDRARRVLDRWTDAVAAARAGSTVTPVGELTGQIGDWEAAVGDNNKRALMAGLVAAGEGLPETKPPDGVVTWADGTSAKVPLLSARDAIAAMWTGAEPCEDCVGLLVTNARLTTGPIETTRGPATAPIWEFRIVGSGVKLTRVALANAVVVEPLFDGNAQLGLAIDSAEGPVSGTEITVAFVGAPDPGDQPCGEDYSAEAIESDLAIVVVVTRHPHFPPFGGGCSAVGARRTANATLSAPLGERAVLDFQLGTPVRMVLHP